MNPSGCPTAEPAADAPCPQLGLQCRYGDNVACAATWGCGQQCNPVCSSNLVWSQGFARRDCPTTCPAAEPHAGDPCTTEKALCTYGSDPGCRTEWGCFGSRWAALIPARACGTTYCPAVAPINSGCQLAQVTPNAGRCVYAYGLVCQCTCIDVPAPPAPGIQITWGCSSTYASFTPADYTCPFEVPVAGTPCQQTGTCDYRSPNACTTVTAQAVVATCVGGQWQVVGG
jgi:hypothetical protein